MFTDSAELATVRPQRPWRLTIDNDYASAISFVVDAAALVATAYAIGGLAQAAGLADVSPPNTLSVACVPISLFLSAAAATGAHRADLVASGALPLSRVVSLWSAALALSIAAAFLLGGAERFESVAIAAFAVVAPFVFRSERLGMARLFAGAAASGVLRLPLVFTVSEAGAGRQITTVADPRANRFELASFTRPDPISLNLMIAAIRRSRADEIHLVPPGGATETCALVLAQLRRVPHPVKVVASPAQAELLRWPVTKAGANLAFEVQRAPLNRVERVLKRAFDVVLSLSLGVALLPVLLLVAAALRCSGPRTVLFIQTRIGFNGQPFRIYKFRTMTVEEDGAEIAQARPGDRRVTTIGKLLRRTSIDELPQLLNVLKGEMSLIGPRPHAAAHDVAFDAAVRAYGLRQRVKPGITGLAQVNGCRGGAETADAVARRVELDLRYIERWSLWLDLWIFLKTLGVVVSADRAY